MKRKIIIGLSTFSLIFILGGIYITTYINNATSTLNYLIELHRVEILREHLLIEIRKAQSNLYLKNTRFARSVDTSMNDVRNMKKAADKCLGCHHSEENAKKLTELQSLINQYMDVMSRVFTTQPGDTRLGGEEDLAFRKGEELIGKLDAMIALTVKKLDERTKSALHEIAGTKRMLFALVAIGPFLTLGLSMLFIRGLTKPVKILLEATRKLKDGDLEYRITGLKDEFGEVAASFNEMLSSLKEQMLKMQRVEQVKMAGEMAAGLAHEIKNPLAGIKVSMQVLAEGTGMAEEDKAILLKVVDQVKRIELLIKSLLDFAKPPKPQFAVVDINALLDSMIAFSLKHPSVSSAETRPISIIRDLDKDVPRTTADPMQLQQVFLNLLINSIEAMPEGGILTVRTYLRGSKDAVHIEISDTGKGINEELADKLFYPFFTTKPKGTGLGLAITKQLVEQHNGSISVSNKAEGGAQFKVVFPVRPVL